MANKELMSDLSSDLSPRSFMILGQGIIQVLLKLVLQRTTTRIVDLTDGSLVTILI